MAIHKGQAGPFKDGPLGVGNKVPKGDPLIVAQKTQSKNKTAEGLTTGEQLMMKGKRPFKRVT